MDVLSLIINIVSILGMITVATIIAMSSYSKSKLFFALTVYVSCIWLFLQYIVQIFSLNGTIGLQLIQFASALSFIMAFLFYGFSRSYINKPIHRWSYVFASVFFVIELTLNMSGFMVQEAWGEHAGVVINRASDLYQIYIIVVGLVFVVAFIELLRSTLKMKLKKDKTRNRLLISGFLQAVILLVVSNTFFQSSAESQMVFPISLLIMSIMVGYAIVKYQFFDIKLAAIRTFAYVLSLITLSAVYFGLAYIASAILFNGNLSQSVSISPVNIFLALLLAFVFQPIKRFFDKVTNKIFYKDNYDSDVFFARLSKTLAFTTNLRGLLERTAEEIGTTLKSEQAFFFVNTLDGHYVSAGTANHKQMPKYDAAQLEGVNNKSHGVIIASLREPNDPTRRLMLSHRIELILPLVQADETIGYLCLGDHLTSGYTTRDMRVLSTIADELTIAIQNALAVQEIRELNASLQQRISNATKELRVSNTILRRLDKAKDEFVSMASHQLRTPLTSVKGYISMVIEGDAGKITDPQKKLLDEAFSSSERMVHLINDFLNVSRIQNGKFLIEKYPTDLSKVVGQEIDSLKPSALSRNLEFVYNPPKDFPIIDVDEGKVRQVVINFADNALYYAREGSKVAIDLSVDGDDALFTVIDTGIGVPSDEQEQLFTKFYRASNARKQRPDGTGVGLYLAKKIIDAHDGKIVFESVEGKGSTFGFRLPLSNSKL